MNARLRGWRDGKTFSAVAEGVAALAALAALACLAGPTRARQRPGVR
jgi:hypothetical protein